MHKVSILEYLGKEVYKPIDEFVVNGNEDITLAMLLMFIIPQW